MDRSRSAISRLPRTLVLIGLLAGASVPAGARQDAGTAR